MTSVEFRDRSRRAPGGDLRIFLGRANKPKDRRVLEARRELLQRIAKRGEYEVLAAIARRSTTPEIVERLVDQYGIGDYRKHLELSPAPDVPTLDTHAERYLETITRVGTRLMYRHGLTLLRDFAVQGERLGAREWHTVRSHHVKDAQASLVARLKPSTLKTYISAWSAFFEWAGAREESEAADQGRAALLDSNPVRKAKVWLPVRPTRHRFLLEAEYEALLGVAPPPMRAQYAALTLCGLRGGELRNLPPAHVHPTHVQIAPWGNWAPKGWPRIERGVRNVPTHPTMVTPLLEEYREEWAGDFTFFVNPRTGRPWTYHAFLDQFNRDAQAAGLVTGAAKDGVTPHTCRHTFASWLAQRDVQLLKIATLMGDTMETVVRFYAALLPSDLDTTILRLFSVPLYAESPTAPRKLAKKAAIQAKG